MAVLNTTSPSPTTSAPSGTPTNERPSSSTSAADVLPLAGNDHRLVDAVLLVDQHLDALVLGGRHVLADVVGADRQLAMTAVDEHGELNRPRPSEVHERVHRRARGAAVVDHVVDQNYDLVVDLGQLRLRSVAVGGSYTQIVTMQSH